MNAEQIRAGASELVSAIVDDAGERADDIKRLARKIEIAFELAVVGGKPDAIEAFGRRIDMLAEIARVNATQAERAAIRNGALLAVRTLRAALLA